jgi:DNA segregation ATPase FtsK/SpoIIIE-like protein
MEKAYINRTYLDRQANQIERALTMMSIPVRVQGGQVTDRWVRYHLEPTGETRATHVVQAAEAVADAIGAEGIRVAERSDGIAIEVPRIRRNALRLLPLLHAIDGIPAMSALIGMQISGQPLILDMKKQRTWHLMVSGRADCGKSELVRTLLASMCLTSRRSQLNVLGIDIGGRELGLIEALPHMLTDLATDSDFAKELIFWLAREIQRRLEYGISKPHLVLFVDDFAGLAAEEDRSVVVALNEIVMKGFESGVHVIGASRDRISLPVHSARQRGGLVTAVPIENKNDGSGAKNGRFRLSTSSVRRDVDVAYLSVKDLDTVVQLANSGWRPISRSCRLDAGERS